MFLRAVFIFSNFIMYNNYILKKVIILNKKEGQTPLQALDGFRARNKKYQNIKMTYAGRLDPMASGVLLVLVDEECKKKDKYLTLSKEYEFSVLFGFATDTYDVLGFITRHNNLLRSQKSITLSMLTNNIKKNLKFFRGKIWQKYPLYSSRTWARARAGEKVNALEREIEVKSFKLIKIRKITPKKLLVNIEKRIQKIEGDFRQKKILKIWQQNLSRTTFDKFLIGDFKIKCSSGTYVRGIANSLGKRIDIPALAFSIKRTKIGKWRV